MQITTYFKPLPEFLSLLFVLIFFHFPLCSLLRDQWRSAREVGITAYLGFLPSLFLFRLVSDISPLLWWGQAGAPPDEMGVKTRLEIFLEFSGLLLFLLRFEFLSPLFILRCG